MLLAMPTTATDQTVARVEAALTTLVRRVKLPAAYERITAAAHVPLDRAAYIVLLRISEWGPLRLSDLAERLDIDVSTASRHIRRLEDDGYVVRTADPDDRRACLLSLSRAGHDAVRRIVRARREALEQVLADWPEEERVRLAELLERFADAFGSFADSPPGTRAQL
jgi:DNA-binding MarR family transcriptional regulator